MGNEGIGKKSSAALATETTNGQNTCSVLTMATISNPRRILLVGTHNSGKLTFLRSTFPLPLPSAL